MSQGRTRAALRQKVAGTPLQLDDVIDVGPSEKRLVKDILAEKHPPASPAHADFIVDTDPQTVHHAIFNDLDARCIRSAALHTEGAAGPSGVDARSWRKLCSSFGSASEELCKALAATARRLCTCLVDLKCLSALVACRLIALSKNPPIGVGETV